MLEMTRKERLESAFTLQTTDRTPILGGWIACPEYIMELAGATYDEYWADPVGVSICAYDILDTDGLIGVFVPRNRTDFRCVDHNSYAHAVSGITLEDTIKRIDDMPTPEKIIGNFDIDSAYENFRNSMIGMQKNVEICSGCLHNGEQGQKSRGMAISVMKISFT